jgi:hypothetical protein
MDGEAERRGESREWPRSGTRDAMECQEEASDPAKALGDDSAAEVMPRPPKPRGSEAWERAREPAGEAGSSSRSCASALRRGASKAEAAEGGGETAEGEAASGGKPEEGMGEEKTRGGVRRHQ